MGLKSGRGREAYEIVMKKLEDLPTSSLVIYEMPRDIIDLLSRMTQNNDPLPFYSDERERRRFDDLCARKEFRWEVNSFPQSEYLAR
jgi:hypothetical protein